MLIHPLPDPVALKIGPISLHWYGLMYLAAFAQYLVLGRMRLKHPHIAAAGWNKKDLDDLMFYIVLGTIIGGRLGEVLFYDPAYFFSNLLEIFALWKGGMSFHGGFLGVIFGIWLWARKNGRSYADVLDFVAPLFPLGFAFGRMGNFINAELHGRIADPSLPWAMIWPNVDNLPRHPSPIYQALVDGVLLFIILWIYARKERPGMAVFGFGTMLYGCARFFTEYFRTPDYEVTLGGITISAGQMLSLPMIAVGLAILLIAYNRSQKSAYMVNVSSSG